jgi:hypothetical protein
MIYAEIIPANRAAIGVGNADAVRDDHGVRARPVAALCLGAKLTAVAIITIDAFHLANADGIPPSCTAVRILSTDGSLDVGVDAPPYAIRTCVATGIFLCASFHHRFHLECSITGKSHTGSLGRRAHGI